MKMTFMYVKKFPQQSTQQTYFYGETSCGTLGKEYFYTSSYLCKKNIFCSLFMANKFNIILIYLVLFFSSCIPSSLMFNCQYFFIIKKLPLILDVNLPYNLHPRQTSIPQLILDSFSPFKLRYAAFEKSFSTETVYFRSKPELPSPPTFEEDHLVTAGLVYFILFYSLSWRKKFKKFYKY